MAERSMSSIHKFLISPGAKAQILNYKLTEIDKFVEVYGKCCYCNEDRKLHKRMPEEPTKCRVCGSDDTHVMAIVCEIRIAKQIVDVTVLHVDCMSCNEKTRKRITSEITCCTCHKKHRETMRVEWKVKYGDI